MNIAIVGLGLIGGSIAKRIKGFSFGKVIGIDLDESVLEMAKNEGVIDFGYTSGYENLNEADLIILCLYPKANVDFLKDNKDFLKPNSVVCDVSGVKEFVISQIEQFLPPDVDFVGAHPMAGREVGGYKSATDTLFDGASFLVVPTEKSREENIELVENMAKHIGFKNIIRTTAKEHDSVIAYTSQLMHVVAVALCNNPMIEKSTYFSAGSLRDCTRVAQINEKMWSELFLENGEELVKRIDEMKDSLDEIKNAILHNSKEMLEQIMIESKIKKEKWLKE